MRAYVFRNDTAQVTRKKRLKKLRFSLSTPVFLKFVFFCGFFWLFRDLFKFDILVCCYDTGTNEVSGTPIAPVQGLPRSFGRKNHLRHTLSDRSNSHILVAGPVRRVSTNDLRTLNSSPWDLASRERRCLRKGKDAVHLEPSVSRIAQQTFFF
jgi:hypothetical protein